MSEYRRLVNLWLDRQGYTIEGLKEIGWALLAFLQFLELHDEILGKPPEEIIDNQE